MAMRNRVQNIRTLPAELGQKALWPVTLQRYLP